MFLSKKCIIQEDSQDGKDLNFFMAQIKLFSHICKVGDVYLIYMYK